MKQNKKNQPRLRLVESRGVVVYDDDAPTRPCPTLQKLQREPAPAPVPLDEIPDPPRTRYTLDYSQSILTGLVIAMIGILGLMAVSAVIGIYRNPVIAGQIASGDWRAFTAEHTAITCTAAAPCAAMLTHE